MRRRGRTPNDDPIEALQRPYPSDLYSEDEYDPYAAQRPMEQLRLQEAERSIDPKKSLRRLIDMTCGGDNALRQKGMGLLSRYYTLPSSSHSDTSLEETEEEEEEEEEEDVDEEEEEEESRNSDGDTDLGDDGTLVTPARSRVLHQLQPSDDVSKGLSFIGPRFVTPAAEHVQRQYLGKRKRQELPDPQCSEEEKEARRIRPEREVMMDRIQKLIDSLDHFFPPDKPRTTIQRLCHYWYIQLLFKWVFGKQWDVVQPRVLARYKLKRVRSMVQVLMERRRGKTWSIASFLAGVLLFIPGINISIFSPTSMQSNLMKDEIYRMLFNYEQNTGYPATRHLVRYNTKNIMMGNRPLPPGKSMNSREADDMVLEPTTSTLLLCNSNIDGKSQEFGAVGCGRAVGSFCCVCARVRGNGCVCVLGYGCGKKSAGATTTGSPAEPESGSVTRSA